MRPTPPMDRRDFLRASTAAAIASAAPGVAWAGRGPIRVLVLGGTDPIGAALVRETVAAGFDVTLLNRGRTNSSLFPDLPLIRMDRTDEQALLALSHHRFDAAIDTWHRSPIHVAASSRALQPHIERYVYISNTAVYRDQTATGIDENSERLLERPSSKSDWGGLEFGERKALAEVLGERELGKRFVALRAHGATARSAAAINRAERHWPNLLSQGGEITVPGDGNDPIQLTDPVELARFATRTIADRLEGPFNVFRTHSFEEYLSGCKAMSSNNATLAWIDKNEITESRQHPLEDFPLWVPRDQSGLFQMSHARADAIGIKHEPLIRSLRKTRSNQRNNQRDNQRSA